jgi:hypothetical protein
MQFDRCEMSRRDEHEQGDLPKRKSIAGQHRLPEQTDHFDFTLGPERPALAQKGDPPGTIYPVCALAVVCGLVRLQRSRRDPEAYFAKKSEIVEGLRQAAREVDWTRAAGAIRRHCKLAADDCQAGRY